MSGPIYSRSQFYRCFADFIKANVPTVFNDSSQKKKNDLMNLGFRNRFLKNHLSYLPLWSGLMTSIRDSTQPRANNVTVEGYFRQLKRQVREDVLVGDFGHVKVGRYVRMLEPLIAADVKKITLNIPARGRLNKRKLDFDSMTEEDAMQSQEMYNKPNSQPSTSKQSIFFGQ